MKISRILTAGACALMLLATGCSVPKDVTYFQNPESVVEIVHQNPIRIEPGDKLTIVVKSKDAAVSDLFNLPVYTQRVGINGISGVVSANSTQNYNQISAEGISGYTVNEKGYIDFPMLGEIKVSGMTRGELAAYIKGELIGRSLVKDATVSVEYLNTGINLMGAVARPGRYEINADNLTILEALSMAGDLTNGGQRKNVKVLREENGKINVYTVDLTDLKGTAASPVYYMHQNDVIYVEPNDIIKRSTTINGNNALSTSFWISVASLITTAVTTVGVFVQK